MAEKELLVDFFGSMGLPDYTLERSLNQITCHVFLMTGAMVNLAYLVFIAGFGTGTLKKNPLQVFVLIGCLGQMLSCGYSITRFNVGDEYNFALANWGAFWGLFGFIFNNIAISTIWIHKSDNRLQKWKIIAAVIVAINIVVFGMQLKTWEETRFQYYRMLNGLNQPYAALCYYFTHRALKSGKITISESIIKTEDLANLFLVMCFFNLFWFVITPTTYITTLIYVGGGLQFMTLNVATHYMGQFDEYYEYSPTDYTAIN